MTNNPASWHDQRMFQAYRLVMSVIAETPALAIALDDVLSAISSGDDDIADNDDPTGIEDARDTVLRENASAIIRAERGRA